jgi:hypothetical protein
VLQGGLGPWGRVMVKVRVIFARALFRVMVRCSA